MRVVLGLPPPHPADGESDSFRGCAAKQNRGMRRRTRDHLEFALVYIQSIEVASRLLR